MSSGGGGDVARCAAHGAPVVDPAPESGVACAADSVGLPSGAVERTDYGTRPRPEFMHADRALPLLSRRVCRVCRVCRCVDDSLHAVSHSRAALGPGTFVRRWHCPSGATRDWSRNLPGESQGVPGDCRACTGRAGEQLHCSLPGTKELFGLTRGVQRRIAHSLLTTTPPGSSPCHITMGEGESPRGSPQWAPSDKDESASDPDQADCKDQVSVRPCRHVRTCNFWNLHRYLGLSLATIPCTPKVHTVLASTTSFVAGDGRRR